jgi:hypothetical protein
MSIGNVLSDYTNQMTAVKSEDLIKINQEKVCTNQKITGKKLENFKTVLFDKFTQNTNELKAQVSPNTVNINSCSSMGIKENYKTVIPARMDAPSDVLERRNYEKNPNYERVNEVCSGITKITNNLVSGDNSELFKIYSDLDGDFSDEIGKISGIQYIRDKNIDDEKAGIVIKYDPQTKKPIHYILDSDKGSMHEEVMFDINGEIEYANYTRNLKTHTEMIEIRQNKEENMLHYEEKYISKK